MSRTFNMVGGIGNARLPAIYVTYPEGSVCTCSNGSKTYTAKDSTGYWLFAGLEVGTWTVTISDPTGTQTDVSTTATITVASEVVSVSLSYTLWLYNRGDEFDDVTAGWRSRAKACEEGWGTLTPTLTKNSDSLYATWSTSSENVCSGLVETIYSPYDFSAKTTVYATIASVTNANSILYFGILDANDNVVVMNRIVDAGSSYNGEVSAPIPESLTSGRPAFICRASNTIYLNPSSLYIYSVKVE